MVRKSSERNANSHSAKHKWNSNEGEGESGPNQLVFRIGRNIQLDGETDGAGQSECQSGLRQRDGRITLPENFDENCTRSKAEHGERNRHKGEVIPHRDAKDTRQK